MTEFNLKIETVLDGILAKANKEGIELYIEPMYGEDENKDQSVAFVQNMESERFGIICTNLEGFNPDDLHFMTFNPKMYQYAKAEGFSKEQCYEAFSKNILKSVELSNFVEFILSEETY